MNAQLLHLLHLVSPALPVGAYAYSQGQEYAVECGFLNSADQSRRWIEGVMLNSLGRLDMPVLLRLIRAWESGAAEEVAYWNRFLLASRESAEFELEDLQMGRALMRLLVSLEVPGASDWPREQSVCFATAFSLAGVFWSLSEDEIVQGFCWSWLENQVAAATKLVPLGQTEAQQILVALMPVVKTCCEQAASMEDDDIGAGLPALAILSAQHETQYSRLFRS